MRIKLVNMQITLDIFHFSTQSPLILWDIHGKTPLILCDEHGKTTAIRMLAQRYDINIELNLEEGDAA